MNSPPLTERKKTKTREEKAKAKEQKDDGLCSTCNNEPTCTHNEARGPALQCEEFDGYEAPPGRIEHIAQSDRENGNGKDAHQYRGLCVNCDYRGECTNAGIEGGVWHCEEYR